MREEIDAAVTFITTFIEKSDKFPQDQLENFRRHLTELLTEKFEKHWFPEIPAKGQAYRCIRINVITPTDGILERAASKCGSSYNDLRLPTELTVWVDPSEVCYRLGESEGSYCTLATFPSESSSSSSLESSPSSSPPLTPFQDRTRRIDRSIGYERSPPQMGTPNKYRHPSDTFLSQVRLKSNFNSNSYYRPSHRCEDPFSTNARFFKAINNNRNHYKNVCRV